MFISQGWQGHCSDTHNPQQCGILDNLCPDNDAFADRGFNTSECVGFYCARLHVPASPTGKTELSAEDVPNTRKLANVCIHAERVIGFMRNKFATLKYPLPTEHVANGDS